jgi:hypothetical protein
VPRMRSDETSRRLDQMAARKRVSRCHFGRYVDYANRGPEGRIDMIYPGLPEDQEVLAAIGKIALRHGQLDYALKMAVRSLAGVIY